MDCFAPGAMTWVVWLDVDHASARCVDLQPCLSVVQCKALMDCSAPQ